MKMAPLDIVDGSYADEDKSFSAQDTVNYLPTSAEQAGTRTPTMLKTPPGLKPAVLIGVNEGEAGMQVAGPVRGTYNAEGRFFAVAGNQLFQISSAGIAIPLGTVPGVGRVSFSHNQVTNGNEILVNNGNAGYIYSTVTQVFQRITDTSYPGGLKAVFINNRFVQIEPARRYAFNSALANGLEYTALDRFTSETSPDLLMSIESIGNQLAAFSSTTTEWFEDTGASPQPFRSTGIVADKGAAGPFTTAKMDNQLFVLADDGVFYRFQGYNPVRISTKPIEQAIRGKNWLNAFTTVWEDSGFAVCYWTFPDGETWGYDASSGKWHRRESYGSNRWRLNSLTFWQNAWYGGDFQNGRLWRLDWDYLLEGDEEIVSSRAAGVISDNQNRVIHERLELVMNTGMEETIPDVFVEQPEGPTISGDAPDGSVGIAWGPYSYTVTGGTPPYLVSIRSGELPAGIGPLSSAGQIAAGVPESFGVSSFKVRVNDVNGLFDELDDSISVSGFMLMLKSLGGSARRVVQVPDYTVWNGIEGNPTFGAQGLVSADSHRVVAYNTTDYSASDDYGITWSSPTLFGAGLCTHIASKPGAGILVACLGSGGVSVSVDNGLSFTIIPSSPNIRIASYPNQSVLIGLSSVSNDYSYSDDDGATWSTGSAHGIITSSGFSVESHSGISIFGGSNSASAPIYPKVSITSDGISVSSVQLSSTIEGSVVSISVGSVGESILWAALTSGGRVYVSDDFGQTWELSPQALSGSGVSSAWNGLVFVAFTNDGANHYIYSSQDAAVWTEQAVFESALIDLVTLR